MSNPHIQNAIHTIGEANNPNSVWESSDTERIALQIEANTRATLAVAYAQETANLIALWTAPAKNAEGVYDRGEELAGVSYGHIADQIKERLNLA